MRKSDGTTTASTIFVLVAILPLLVVAFVEVGEGSTTDVAVAEVTIDPERPASVVGAGAEAPLRVLVF